MNATVCFYFHNIKEWKLKINKYKFLISGIPFATDQKGRWRKTFKNYYLYAETKKCYIYVRFMMN